MLTLIGNQNCYEIGSLVAWSEKRLQESQENPIEAWAATLWSIEGRRALVGPNTLYMHNNASVTASRSSRLEVQGDSLAFVIKISTRVVHML